MIYFLTILVISVVSATDNDTITTRNNLNAATCEDNRCGCNRDYVFDRTQNKCVYVLPNSTERVIIYNENQDHDILADSHLARAIYLEGEQIFKGIMISVMLFVACASVCVVAACVYCCRINYTDRELHKEVKTVAKVLNKDYKSKKATKSTKLQPIQETCNVVVADADVFVV